MVNASKPLTTDKASLKILGIIHDPIHATYIKGLHTSLDTLTKLLPPIPGESPPDRAARKESLIAMAVNAIHEKHGIGHLLNEESTAQLFISITGQLVEMNADSKNHARWAEMARKASLNRKPTPPIGSVPIETANAKVMGILKTMQGPDSTAIITHLYRCLDDDAMIFPPVPGESTPDRRTRQDRAIALAINFIHEENGTDFLLSKPDKRDIVAVVDMTMIAIYNKLDDARWTTLIGGVKGGLPSSPGNAL